MTHGFTLIECLVYLALTSLLISLSYAATVAIAASTGRADSQSALLREAMHIESYIRTEMYRSQGIESAHDGRIVFMDGSRATHIEQRGMALFAGTDTTEYPVSTPGIEVRAFATDYHPSRSELRINLELVMRSAEGVTVSRSDSFFFYL